MPREKLMRIRCPVCYTEHALEAILEDEAARELMGVLADLPREVSRPLVAYLGLWRSRTRALAWDRALRIAREALALHADTTLLGAALAETVEAIRTKRERGEDTRPLSSHHYLRRVLETVAARGVSPQPLRDVRPAPASRTAQALAALGRPYHE